MGVTWATPIRSIHGECWQATGQQFVVLRQTAFATPLNGAVASPRHRVQQAWVVADVLSPDPNRRLEFTSFHVSRRLGSADAANRFAGYQATERLVRSVQMPAPLRSDLPPVYIPISDSVFCVSPPLVRAVPRSPQQRKKNHPLHC